MTHFHNQYITSHRHISISQCLCIRVNYWNLNNWRLKWMNIEHNYGLEPILLLSPGQLHTHRTCTYGHGGAHGRPHDHRCRFGRVKIFKNFFLYFWNLHIMIREKMQKNKNKIFFPAKMTPSWDLVSGAWHRKTCKFFGFSFDVHLIISARVAAPWPNGRQLNALRAF